MASLNKAKASATKTASASKPTTKPTAKPAAKAAPAKKGFPAKKTGASAKKAAPAKPKPQWMAPADFKPAFFKFAFATDQEGLIDPASVQGQRVRGRWDNPEAKTYDLREYDVNTLVGFIARMSAAVWGTNPTRRIPGETTYQMVVRVTKRSATGALAVRIVGVHHKVEGKKGKWFEDKTDPTFRKIRRAARWLPAAFTDVQLPPSRSTKRKVEAEDDGEE